MEIITLVEQFPLRVKATRHELGVNRATFYSWYDQYLNAGYDGLADSAYRLMKAADYFYNPTTAPNQLWQTDFTARAAPLL